MKITNSGHKPKLIYADNNAKISSKLILHFSLSNFDLNMLPRVSKQAMVSVDRGGRAV